MVECDARGEMRGTWREAVVVQVVPDRWWNTKVFDVYDTVI